MSINFTEMFLGFFILCIAIQVGYYFFFFRRIYSLGVKKIAEQDMRPISIIICAKNEAENLRENIPTLLSQRYSDTQGQPLYEVIVVNDGSSDNTRTVIEELKHAYPNLKVLDSQGQGKKGALATGAAVARYDWLVMIDADCCPASDKWLVRMAEPLARGKEIVMGYGGYYQAPGMLNAFILWETMHTFLQYSTYALAGLPYMAVGRNMACTKQTLRHAMQQPIWSVLPSGDDDMLVRVAGTKDNTAVVCHQEAFTNTHAKKTWGEWANQKRRHLSTGKYYKWHIKLLLGIYGIAHAAMWLSFFVLLMFGIIKISLILMGVRCFLYWFIWAVHISAFNGHSFFKRTKLRYLLPLFDFGWMIYNFAFLPYITLKNKKNWK